MLSPEFQIVVDPSGKEGKPPVGRNNPLGQSFGA
jgi:hypothetical protein